MSNGFSITEQPVPAEKPEVKEVEKEGEAD